MGKLNLDQLRPGMVLAADVRDRNNRILLKAGLELSEKYLTILRQWGVTEADIQGVEREEAEAEEAIDLDPRLLAAAEASYQELFRHTNTQHPFIRELLRLSIRRTVLHTMQELRQ